MDNNQPVNVSERLYRLLKNYWQVGVAFTVTIAFFLISKDHIKQMILTDPLQGATLLLLLIFTIVWFVAYIHATFNELEMLHGCNIEVAIGMSNWLPLFLILSIALCFGVLIAFIDDMLFYSIFAILLILFNSIGFVIVQRSIFVTAFSSKTIPQSIIEYYLYRPFLLHQLGMLSGFFLSLLFSVIFHYTQTASLKIVAPIIAIITILLGEYFVFHWRKIRDKLVLTGH